MPPDSQDVGQSVLSSSASPRLHENGLIGSRRAIDPSGATGHPETGLRPARRAGRERETIARMSGRTKSPLRKAVRSSRVRRPRQPEWAGWSDEKLLDLRLCDLDLRIEGTSLEARIEQLYRELEYRRIQFRPHFWLSDDWFTPDGVPGIAIPFYLAHPRLARLERRQMLEVEGGTAEWCMRILRHETGHAIDNAYGLRRRRRRQQLFGRSTQPYPEYYTPRPYSKSFVVYLEPWYAQSHPDEDFAETFAVWLHPRLPWRRRYADWPALKKLEYMNELIGEIRGRKPPVTAHRRVDSAAAPAQDPAAALPGEARPLRPRLPERLRPRPAPPVFRRSGVSAQHHRGALHHTHPRRGARHRGALDRGVPVHDQAGDRGHHRPLPRARACASSAPSSRPGSTSRFSSPCRR